ncbi:MAG: c-type cytochrome [Alphaproteobacteria bacterium]|nr:c-type cytochrome [Alphaproteobacteria bacterium]
MCPRIIARPALALLAALSVLAAAASSACAAGDVAAGERVFKNNCTICHAATAGGLAKMGPALENEQGPTLSGIVGRHSASVPDYPYSEAMRKAGKIWDDPTLDAYLTPRRNLVPGNKMLFVGLENAQDRRNLIAYLATLRAR